MIKFTKGLIKAWIDELIKNKDSIEKVELKEAEDGSFMYIFKLKKPKISLT